MVKKIIFKGQRRFFSHAHEDQSDKQTDAAKKVKNVSDIIN